MKQLSPRQMEVCEFLKKGMRNKEIATKMGVTEKTVKFHIWSINCILGTRNRSEILIKVWKGDK